MRENRVIAGASRVMAAAFMFACMSAVLKLATEEVNTAIVVFFRSLFGFLFLIPWLFSQKKISIKTTKIHLHLIRCVLGLCAMYCFFHAISLLHLGEAVLLSYSFPLFLPFISYIFLKERASFTSWIAVIVGFIGVGIIEKPSTGIINPDAIFGICAAIFAAGAMVSIRYMAPGEPSPRIVFYYSLLSALFSAPPALISWQTPSISTMLALILSGAFATGGQLLLSSGYSIASPGKIGSFSYFVVPFGVLFGWLFWSETPSPASFAGFALVVGAGLLSGKPVKRHSSDL